MEHEQLGLDGTGCAGSCRTEPALRIVAQEVEVPVVVPATMISAARTNAMAPPSMPLFDGVVVALRDLAAQEHAQPSKTAINVVVGAKAVVVSRESRQLAEEASAFGPILLTPPPTAVCVPKDVRVAKDRWIRRFQCPEGLGGVRIKPAKPPWKTIAATPMEKQSSFRARKARIGSSMLII